MGKPYGQGIFRPVPFQPLCRSICSADEARTDQRSVEPLLKYLGVINLEGIRWLIAGGERPTLPTGGGRLDSGYVASARPLACRSCSRNGGTRKHLTGSELDDWNWDEYPDATIPVPRGVERMERRQTGRRSLHKQAARGAVNL